MPNRKGNVTNPHGKGGFGDNPQNRNPGGWNKHESISYQYNMLMRLSVDQFQKWLRDNPENTRTMAQQLAYDAMIQARAELSYLKEITDRTEGKPMQRQDITSGDEKIGSLYDAITAAAKSASNED